MIYKALSGGEGIWTSDALELLVVGLHVSSEVRSVCKLLSALRTSEGFLSRVRSHMSLQQPGSGESFVADITFMREVVG